MSSRTAYEEFVNRKTQAAAMLREAGLAAVQELFQPYFDQYPDMLEIGWVQFIPGFNDGEACEFTIRPRGVKFSRDFYDRVTKVDFTLIYSAETAQRFETYWAKALETMREFETKAVSLDTVTMSEYSVLKRKWDEDYEDDDFDFYLLTSRWDRKGIKTPDGRLSMFRFPFEQHKDLLQVGLGPNAEVYIRRMPDGSIQVSREDYNCGY